MSRGRIGVGAVVVRTDGRILIGRRVKAGEPTSWCLPGGHVEPGETFEQAALRELTEEAGLRSGRGRNTFVVTIDRTLDLPNATAGVVIELDDDTEQPIVTEPDTLDQWVWTDPKKLPERLFPATAAVLAAWQTQPAPAGWESYLCR